MQGTSSPLGPDYINQILALLTAGVAQATAHAYRMMWEILLSFLAQHWLGTLVTLVCILLLAILEYLVTRRWATLGSVLYNYFYFGIMFLIGLIDGPELYANDYFPIVATLVYIVSFSIVGFILISLGIQRPYGRR